MQGFFCATLNICCAYIMSVIAGSHINHFLLDFRIFCVPDYHEHIDVFRKITPMTINESVSLGYEILEKSVGNSSAHGTFRVSREDSILVDIVNRVVESCSGVEAIRVYYWNNY